MSVPYGMPVGGVYQPPGRVNFGWIGEAFELFKANVGVWLVASLLAFIPTIIGSIIGAAAGASGAVSQPQPGENPFSNSRLLTGGLPPGLSLGLRIFGTVYGAWLSGGVYRTAVKQVRGEPISIGDLFSGGAVFLNMLGFNIVSGIVIGIGFVLCILPGLLLTGLLFPGPALVADGESVGNALSRSFNAMKQDMWNAAGFTFVMGLLVLASVFACGLGEFVTIPMFYLVAALAYRDMIGMPGVNQAAPAYGAAGPGVWPPAPSAAPPPPQWGTSADAPPAYPGYVPQPTSSVPPPAPSWSTTPVPPQSYPSVPAQSYPPAEPTVYPPPETPTEFPPISPPEEPPATPPASSWSPRPPSGP